jgi:hypothetical protein
MQTLIRLIPVVGLALLLPLGGNAAPRDLTANWQPAPHPSMPERVQVLTDVDTPLTSPPEGSPHVVLVTVETWRADRLGLYGSPRPTSDWLDELATDAWVFDRATAPSSWTWPTMSSIASGKYPRGHGATRMDAPLCSEAETLAETFHDGGWRTGFVGSNEYFEPYENNFRQGFEFYFASGSELAGRVLEYSGYFLDGGWTGSDPFFLHVHFFDPHCPYVPSDSNLARVLEVPYGPTDWGSDPEPVITWDMMSAGCHAVPIMPPEYEGPTVGWQIRSDPQDYLDVYDAELVGLDRSLMLLKATLAAAGAWDDAWVVITGDHGEGFGEHGKVGHGDDVYSESNWVPLVIRPPGGAGANAGRFTQPVSLVDVPFTLATVAGAKVPESWDGRDLSPLFRGEELPSEPVYSETVYVLDSWGAMIDDGEYRLVVEGLLPMGHLYAASDRMDLDDLFERPMDLHTRVVAAQMAGKLHRELQCQTVRRVCEQGVMEMDPVHLEALRALGYTAEVSARHPELRRTPVAPMYDVAERPERGVPTYPTLQECSQ